MKLLLTCPFWLSSLLAKEIKRLNLPLLETKTTAVLTEGDRKNIYQLNLRSRLANKVYLILKEANIETFDQLFDTVSKLPRQDYCPSSSNLSLQVITKNSQLSSERSIQSVAHKAILTSLSTETSPSQDTSPKTEIFLHLENNQLKICLNTSGPSLHQRGYRLHTWPAPIKENLAAAMVLLSTRKFKAPLTDPFCGSGTLLIEAAMLAKNLAPGAKRSFAFQNFKTYDQHLRKSLLQDAQQKTFQGTYQLFASDIDEEVLHRAKQNAQRAEVADCISFSCAPFKAETFPQSPHRLLTNPPYGKRLTDTGDLFPLYQALAVTLSHKGVQGGIVSSFPELASLLPSSLFSHKTRFNGADQVQFFRKK